MAFHGQNRPPHPKKGKENYMNDNNTKEQVRDRKTDTVDPRPDTQRTTRKTYDPPLYAARRWNERGHDELFFDSYAEEGVDGRVAITPIPSPSAATEGDLDTMTQDPMTVNNNNNNATNMIDQKYEDLVAENTTLVHILEEKAKLCHELREENLKLKGRLWEALKIKI
jgi:hypothetical protein